MQLIDYVNILRRRWWAILLVAFAATVAAFLFSKAQTPVYRAEAYYSVSPSRLDASLTQVMQSSMNNMRDSALAKSQLEKVSAQLHLDRSADWLLDDVVSMQALPNEWKMVVRVDYPEESDTAARLADAIGENMVALQTAKNAQTDGTDKIYISVQDHARYIGMVKPNTRVNVAAGFVLGLILGLLLAFLIEAMDNTLKTAQDVERFVGLTTLGAIPHQGERRGTSLARRLKLSR
ncbi:lipopolysaccharide biosynthesis protein [Chloroflexia bacterium SDU3-3]|nr:lipopolysaccharide biosynthesis protein [Chloroflexia bacterium SDU3-3]